METGEKKYEKVLNILRSSKPGLTDTGAVIDKIMRKLREEESKVSFSGMIIEFMFGWVYIGWVRKSMIVAALAIFVLFGYQQALIIRRIDDLSGQRIQNGTLFMTNLRDDFTRRIRLFKVAGGKLSNEKPVVQKEEIDEMIRSLNNLQAKYKDLFDIIENDPELKRYVEDRINEIRKSKN